MKMGKISVILLLVVVFLVSLSGISSATSLGTAFTYQGRLIDANSTADGLYDFQFSLYDANTAGSQLGGDVNKPDVDVIDGYFTVELDFGSSVFDGNAVWLEIGVIRQSVEYDPFLFTTLSPRQEITPTPYALYAKSAGTDNDWTISGSNIYSTVAGNVGIGTSTPLYPLHAVDTTPSSDVSAVYGEHAVTDYYGIGVQGVSLYKGVVGSVSATGSSTYYGVAGSAQTSSSGGTSYGVYGSSSGGNTSYGVFGVNYSNSYGVYGKNNSSGNYGYLGDPNYGVYGKNNSSHSYGYLGGYSHGVYGQNNNNGNYGYLGDPNYGAYGKNYNRNYGYLGGSGYGVYGKNYNYNYGYLGGFSYGAYGKYGIGGNYGYLGGLNYGAYGEYDSNSYGYLGGNGYGVYGRYNYTNGYAVYGLNSGRGTVGYLGGPYAVYGNSGSSYAGYFVGNVWVSYNLSALSFTDRTPYPKDLATAYDAVMSMGRLPDGQYDENDKQIQLDHSRLSDFIRSKDGNRDLSATVSCQNEVLKDIIRKQNKLGKDSGAVKLLKQQVESLQAQNELLQQRLETQEKTLQQLQIIIIKGAIQ